MGVELGAPTTIEEICVADWIVDVTIGPVLLASKFVVGTVVTKHRIPTGEYELCHLTDKLLFPMYCHTKNYRHYKNAGWPYYFHGLVISAET